jgi:hypothetical protein
MNRSPEDDPHLAAFLRQHKPIPPAAAADLEDQIIAHLTTEPAQFTSPDAPPNAPSDRQWGRSGRNFTRLSRSRWFVASSIAAGFVAAFVGYRSLQPPPPSEAELADLETFIEGTWQGNISSQPALATDDLFAPVQNSTAN